MRLRWECRRIKLPRNKHQTGNNTPAAQNRPRRVWICEKTCDRAQVGARAILSDRCATIWMVAVKKKQIYYNYPRPEINLFGTLIPGWLGGVLFEGTRGCVCHGIYQVTEYILRGRTLLLFSSHLLCDKLFGNNVWVYSKWWLDQVLSGVNAFHEAIGFENFASERHRYISQLNLPKYWLGIWDILINTIRGVSIFPK